MRGSCVRPKGRAQANGRNVAAFRPTWFRCLTWIVSALAWIPMSSCKNQVSGGGRGRGPKTQGTIASGAADANYQLTALQETVLKARIAESSNLALNEKCAIAAGTSLALTQPGVPSAQQHVQVQLAQGPSGCALVAGFLFRDHIEGNGLSQDTASTAPNAQDAQFDGCDLPQQMDQAAGEKLADIAQSRSVGSFLGKCYEYVGIALEKAGIMPVGAGAWASAGIATTSAADFVTVEKSTVANKVVRLRPKSWACVPRGTVVVWGRGVCRFSGAHGHIEVVVRQNKENPAQSKLCSDGCQGIDTGCPVNSGVSFFYPRKQ